jgi:hypothetical protein
VVFSGGFSGFGVFPTDVIGLSGFAVGFPSGFDLTGGFCFSFCPDAAAAAADTFAAFCASFSLLDVLFLAANL